MAFQGINTGSVPNDGTGDSLLVGGIKVNSNFTELYSLLGNGSTLAVGVVTNTGDASGVTGITTLIQAGSNISVTTNSGISTIAYTGVANTANISANTVNVSGIVTATSFNGSGASLTGVLTALNLDGADGSGLVGVVTTLAGADASGVTGITTLIQAGSNITVTTTSGITTIASTASGGSTANVSTNTLNVIGVTTASDVNISGIVTAGIGTIRSLRVGALPGPSAPNGQLAVVNPAGVAALTVGQNVDGSGQNHLGFYYNGPAAPFAANMFTSNGNIRFVTDGAGGGAVPLIQQAGFSFGVNGNFTNRGLVEIHSVTPAAGVSTALVVNGSTETDGLNVLGVSTFQGRMIGTDTNNVIPFYYNNYSDFPSSSTYHGAVAHAHNTGKLYFAHAGWKELVNKESDGTVGTGTETYNVGLITAIGNNLVTSQWTLGASGSSHYTFTGPGNLSGTSDPVIYLARGQTYQFVNNSGGSHPFEIRTSNGGSAYSTGVTNNSAASGVIKFEVPFDAPNLLYYQCTNHAGMGGTVVVYPDRFTV